MLLWKYWQLLLSRIELAQRQLLRKRALQAKKKAVLTSIQQKSSGRQNTADLVNADGGVILNAGILFQDDIDDFLRRGPTVNSLITLNA